MILGFHKKHDFLYWANSTIRGRRFHSFDTEADTESDTGENLYSHGLIMTAQWVARDCRTYHALNKLLYTICSNLYNHSPYV